jgi:hypothetical protein
MQQQGRYLNEYRFDNICQQYEITGQFAQYLRHHLINYKVVLVCDDSGSMSTLTRFREPRWAELCRFVSTVFSVTECIEQSPLDVYFLNRPSLLNVQQLGQITEAFAAPPCGPTPIVPVLRHALAQPCPPTYMGRIFILCTDGEPTDQYDRPNPRQLYDLLARERRYNDYVTILACTDDDSSIEYLNRWDVLLPRLDVVDDYENEKKEVLWAQGRQFRFSFGDYVVKILLGSVVPQLDRLDEAECRCAIS